MEGILEQSAIYNRLYDKKDEKMKPICKRNETKLRGIYKRKKIQENEEKNNLKLNPDEYPKNC